MNQQYTVIWSNTSRDAAHQYAADDPAGMANVLDAADLIAKNPRPDGAASLGDNRVRIHIGFYRVVYEIHDDTIVIEVIHLGRSGL